MVEEIIGFLGGAKQISADFGYTTMAVYQWKKRGIPAHMCIEIEKMSEGKYRAVDLWGGR